MRAKFIDWWVPSSTTPVQGFVPGVIYDFTAEQIDALVRERDVMIADLGVGAERERCLCVDQKGGRFRQR